MNSHIHIYTNMYLYYLKNLLPRNAAVLLIIGLSCFWSLRFSESKLPQDEVDALQQIAITMGAKYWKFNGDSCQVEQVGVTPQAPSGSESTVYCPCNFTNDIYCHVTTIVLKGFSLPGVLPPELVKLPYIQTISVLANRLSGEIPKELGNVSSLTFLNLEANKFSGSVPPELGKLNNLNTLMLSSNQLSGKLPTSFAELQNLTDFRINDNNFSGAIPDFIQNWKQLQRLRISDINGTAQEFPNLGNTAGLEILYSAGNLAFTARWNFLHIPSLRCIFNSLSLCIEIQGERQTHTHGLVSQSSLGVRTRLKSLALQRLRPAPPRQNHRSSPPPIEAIAASNSHQSSSRPSHTQKILLPALSQSEHQAQQENSPKLT
ncbi:hypothetical protein HYC85_017518 [Camellia sinensis]|uniref:Disease resistance R13L4/SHOC-2-like LRR domain-containing protein n=1 Tax=Camellia sinensis TaxID=4442 RepID=A0A7J7GU42_CAMSI|nr:hypothetical protein HYC85_017518 [Camellia sinensis]